MSDLVSAIRDFCERECGVREKREQLTRSPGFLKRARQDSNL